MRSRLNHSYALLAFVVVLFSLGQARANTESIVVSLSSEQFIVTNPKEVPQYRSNSTCIANCNSINLKEVKAFTITASAHTNSEYTPATKAQQLYNYEYFAIQDEGLSNSSPDDLYNIRVCWPALYPLSLDVRYINLCLSTNCSRLVQLRYHSRFYSNNHTLMAHDLDVPINLHLVPTFSYKKDETRHYNLPIPIDLLSELRLVATIFIVCLFSSRLVYSFIKY
ncbi:Pga1p ASCRUDRAFT_105818 [Ascoidea rubescens DSM 1968]|uniref:Uncharacterized protein n=1 Tax=Ascoidea rubescens DSM 1968 TaxID=1344418 RepID=A0A1D2VSB3_9ASCO|nr:hypothetical protein ASCRUDRAFT_105818 [Ascoidea rubescens DSM 1968]ODV64512.1 hypothetical protein ASCRUDRAFT_105818 [Ascoidea rubescens DSM 1968]